MDFLYPRGKMIEIRKWFAKQTKDSKSSTKRRPAYQTKSTDCVVLNEGLPSSSTVSGDAAQASTSATRSRGSVDSFMRRLTCCFRRNSSFADDGAELTRERRARDDMEMKPVGVRSKASSGRNKHKSRGKLQNKKDATFYALYNK